MIIIQQNTTTKLSFILTNYFEEELINTMVAAELTIGEGKLQIHKLWYANDYNNNNSMNYYMYNNVLECILQPSETARWQYQVPVQIRIKTMDKKIHTGDILYAYIQHTLSSEEF